MSLNWERCSLVTEHVNEEAIAKLGFKPGAFWGHNTVSIGDGHQFLNGCRIQPERDSPVTTVHQHSQAVRCRECRPQNLSVDLIVGL